MVELREDLEKRLIRIEERLDTLERLLANISVSSEHISTREISPSVKDLLSLPDTLRRTLLALQSLGEATAGDVAKKTERTRSIETVYLNQLCRLNFVTRRRVGRKVHYKVARYY